MFSDPILSLSPNSGKCTWLASTTLLYRSSVKHCGFNGAGVVRRDPPNISFDCTKVAVVDQRDLTPTRHRSRVRYWGMLSILCLCWALITALL